jgi:hypothetical protein
MQPNNISAQQALQALDASNSLVGRNQGPELLNSSTVDLTNGATVTPNFLAIRRPIAELLIRLRFRVAVTVANYVAVGCEAPQNILQRIILTGSHAQYGSQTLFNMTGATAFLYPSLFSARGGGSLLINDVLASRPGQPITSSFLGTTAGSPYDVDMTFRLPMAPFVGIGSQSKKQAAAFWLQAADWGDSLQLSMLFGDKSHSATRRARRSRSPGTAAPAIPPSTCSPSTGCSAGSATRSTAAAECASATKRS